MQYSQISAGSYHTCGIRTDNSLVECWGYNGDGTSTVSPNVPYTHISAGSAHTCAIWQDYSLVKCWGSNRNGQSTVSPDVPYGLPPCGTRVAGEWQKLPGGYSSGGQTISYRAGFGQSTVETESVAFKAEVTASVKSNFWFGEAEVSTYVGTSYERDVTSSMEISQSVEQTKTFDQPGQIWQWVYTLNPACRPDDGPFNSIGTKDLVLTPRRDLMPCCPPGYATDPSVQHGPCYLPEVCSRDTCASVCDALPSPPPPSSPSPDVDPQSTDPQCFPSLSTVQRADGETVPLSSLSAGDSILAAAADGTLLFDAVGVRRGVVLALLSLTSTRHPRPRHRLLLLAG